MEPYLVGGEQGRCRGRYWGGIEELLGISKFIYGYVATGKILWPICFSIFEHYWSWEFPECAKVQVFKSSVLYKVKEKFAIIWRY